MSSKVAFVNKTHLEMFIETKFLPHLVMITVIEESVIFEHPFKFKLVKKLLERLAKFFIKTKSAGFR
jgi:hypothetical protein